MAVTDIPRKRLGKTGLDVPPVIFGTSAFGNLYRELSPETKRAIAEEWFQSLSTPVVVDSAGKYGAGLALEAVGDALRTLSVPSEDVIVSNKLGWKRVPLKSSEPLFEPGVWHGLSTDAEQRIGYEGILQCYEQGNELLGLPYSVSLVSVHDPDEYISAGDDHQKRFADIVEAYRALSELRDAGFVRGVGVGSKDWTVIRRLSQVVELDWVMFACSFTVYTHSPEITDFMEELDSAGIGIINSAVFNSGFLVGGDFFDYRAVDRKHTPELFAYRDAFQEICRNYEISPRLACVEFGLSGPGVAAVALNTSNPDHVSDNVASTQFHAPKAFWQEMRRRGLIRDSYDRL